MTRDPFGMGGSTLAHQLAGLKYLDGLRTEMGAPALRHLDAAVAGDAEAACGLVAAAPNECRGHIAIALYLLRVPRPAFREMLLSVWDHDHNELVASGRERLRAMFRYAAFPMPPHLGKTVRIWRGTRGVTFHEAARGLAWTTDRDVACWFTVAPPHPMLTKKPGRPLVLVADVPRGAIMLYTDERSEREAVVFDVPNPRIDGTAEDWRIGYQRIVEAKNAAAESDRSAEIPGAAVHRPNACLKL